MVTPVVLHQEMAAIQCILRLPACIRAQAFTQLSARKVAPVHQQELFSITSRAFSSTTWQRAAPRKSSRLAPFSKAVKQPTTGSTLRSPSSPPVLKASEPIRYAQSLLGNNDEILLYKAPSHKSFTILSLSTGAMLLLGAYTLATNAELIKDSSQDTKQDTTRNRLARYTAMGTAIITASFATVCILAPAAVIISISLRAVPSMQTGSRQEALLVLRTREWPFAPTREIQLPPKQAKLDKRVASAGDDIDYTNIPITQARMFTVDAQGPAILPAKPDQGLIGRALAALFRDTRRMFLRDGFCRLRAGKKGKNWKLDLQHCELLDWGRPLERLTSPDTQPGVGIIAWMRRRGWIG